MSAFAGFVGNSETVQRLDSMLNTSRVPHAIILEGAPGTGRRTLANMLARAIACTGDNKPCGVCECCRIGDNPDIVTVTPDKSTITVDRIRAVRDEAYILPNQSDKRVFIIPDANLMNEQAQNALLKVFEEPPQRIAFILTCEYSGQLLGTVVSRAAVLKLTAPSENSAAEYIAAKYPEYERDMINDAVASECGNIGRALQILLGGGKSDTIAKEILAALPERSELMLMKALTVLEKDRLLAKDVLSRMTELLGDTLSVKVGAPRRLSDGDIRVILSQKITRAHLIGLMQVCKAARSDCEANCNGSLMVTNLCACIREQIDL